MPRPSERGFTHMEDATEKWGRYRSWWYAEVREGRLTGYKSPMYQGTFLRDEEVAAYIQMRPMTREEREAANG